LGGLVHCIHVPVQEGEIPFAGSRPAASRIARNNFEAFPEFCGTSLAFFIRSSIVIRPIGRRLSQPSTGSTLMLLAIEDITQRRDVEREKDDLLRQKEMLLQEMQHRVANSLRSSRADLFRRFNNS
jgi:hypothetical protein